MTKLTPIQAIRKKCLDCQENHYSLVRNCEIKDCPLYPYRLGKRLKSDNSKTGQIAR